MFASDSFRSFDIKQPEVSENIEQKNRFSVPDLNDLKSRLQNIFTVEDRDSLSDEEAPHESVFSENNAQEAVILEDGTIVTLPQKTNIKKTVESTEFHGNMELEQSETTQIRELTEEEKEDLKETLGWTDKQISKCTIDENGVIHYKTDRADMEGKTGENGVKYERKTVDIHGIKVEGVFPVFESVCDVHLPEDMEKASNARQFKECNRQLKEKTESDENLQKVFSEEQLEEIEDGDTPSGYVWHHNEETGKMQLVKMEDHDRTQGGAAHTGGKALWGGSYSNHENLELNENEAVAQMAIKKEEE